MGRTVAFFMSGHECGFLFTSHSSFSHFLTFTVRLEPSSLIDDLTIGKVYYYYCCSEQVSNVSWSLPVVGLWGILPCNLAQLVFGGDAANMKQQCLK